MTTGADRQLKGAAATVINGFLAFAHPYIAVVAGVVADWLFVHLHFLVGFHDHDTVVMGITQFVVWGLTSILVWVSTSRWFRSLEIKVVRSIVHDPKTGGA